jgi:ABC-type multidrug transport system ATPase subunit
MSARPQLPLAFRNVTVRYPNGAIAVKDLSLEIMPGEVFGLVGPNGAGKSTLLNCAAGLIPTQSGAVLADGGLISGLPRTAARHLVLMPDPLGVYLDISAVEYMEFFARAYELPPSVAWKRIDLAVERLGLAPWLEQEVESLSSGWQRRLALSRILIADAPIVLLDEPASGLDISGRRELLKLVRGFATEGRTVLVTSHILPELEELADRFGIIQKGQWVPVREGQVFFTRADLRAGFTQGHWWLECSDPAGACALIGAEKATIDVATDRIRLAAIDRDDAAACVAQLAAAGHKIYHLEAAGRSLDDVTLNALRTPGS